MIMSKLSCRAFSLVSVILISIIFFSGCQPTPDQSPVVGKQGTLAAQIEQPPATEVAYIAPEEWNDQVTQGQLTVKINAEVIVPKTTKYPILKIQPGNIDIDYVRKIADTYIPEQPLYQFTDRTKSDIDKQILARKALISKAKADPSSVFGFGVDESSIAILEEEKIKAPDSVEKEIADFSLKSTPEGSMLYVQTEKGDYISLFNGKDNIYNTLYFTKAFPENGQLVDTMMRSNNYKMPISLSQAKDQADKFLQSIGLDYYRFFDEELAIRITDAQYDVFAGITTDPKFLNQAEKGYVLFYTPCYSGIPKNFSFTDNIIETQGDSYNQIWGDELIRLYIGKDGVEKMEWSDGKGVITETINENIGLVPFETIQERFLEQIFRSFYTDTINSNCKVTLEITRITLSYRKILIQGTNTEYMLVPAWDFYGRKIMQFPPGTDMASLNLQVVDDHTAIEEYFSHSHLTLSAIDGSVIDNIQGY